MRDSRHVPVLWLSPGGSLDLRVCLYLKENWQLEKTLHSTYGDFQKHIWKKPQRKFVRVNLEPIRRGSHKIRGS